MSTIIRDGKKVYEDGARIEHGAAGKVDPATVPSADVRTVNGQTDNAADRADAMTDEDEAPIEFAPEDEAADDDAPSASEDEAPAEEASDEAEQASDESETADESGEDDAYDTAWMDEADGVRVDGPNGSWYDIVDVLHDQSHKEQGLDDAKAKAEALRERHRTEAAAEDETDEDEQSSDEAADEA